MFAHVANQAGDVGDVAISEWNPFRGVETEKDVAGIYVKSMLCSSLKSREVGALKVRCHCESESEGQAQNGN